MSADHRLYLRMAVIAGLFACDTVLAEEAEEMPDVEFLEYLGSWTESDEDWLILDTADKLRAEVEKEDRGDPGPEGEQSTESDDEDE